VCSKSIVEACQEEVSTETHNFAAFQNWLQTEASLIKIPENEQVQ
jgi:hypothetical protein